MASKKLRSASGAPYFDHQDAHPVLLQDLRHQENLAHFVRERIPERAVYAKGSGAYGTFTVTHDLSKFTGAKIFGKKGNECRIFARFSKIGGERGSADTTRDTSGFAIKFYTEDGNWDLVANNFPVFFIKDAKKFPDLIHSQKKDPRTNLKNATAEWDFWSHTPESLHHLLMLLSERGIPAGYPHMHAFGAHTYSFLNASQERFWVKFHLKTQQGIENLSPEEARKLRGDHPDFYQQALVEAIIGGKHPRWKMYVQIMTEEQAQDFRWNPFDVTKVWFHEDFPLQEVGELVLNELPENYFAHVEQAAFSPSHLVPGISFSPDKVLQGRLFAYPDAQRYRLGVNSHRLEVNRCPLQATNYQRDGAMADAFDYGGAPNYFPNSFDGFETASDKKGGKEDPALHVPHLDQTPNEDDHYTQPGFFYTKALDDEGRKILIENIVESMKEIRGEKSETIINRQLCHFFRANIELGMKVAMGLQINIDSNMMIHSAAKAAGE